MSFFSEIEKIREQNFSFVVLGVILFLAPGFSYVFLYFRDLLISLDIFKLILLALSLSTPFFMINIFTVHVTDDATVTKDLSRDLFAKLLFSVIISSVIIYFTLLLVYLFKLPSRAFMYVALSIQAFILALTIIEVLKNKSKK